MVLVPMYHTDWVRHMNMLGAMTEEEVVRGVILYNVHCN